MRYGVCDTSPTHKNRTGDIYAFWDGWRWRRRTTPEHVRAGLPGWVSPSVVEAKLSAAPTATVKRIAAEYRIAGRLIDASIVEDQAFAFGLLPREEMAAIYAARNALELVPEIASQPTIADQFDTWARGQSVEDERRERLRGMVTSLEVPR